MKTIKANNGIEFIVDDEDYDYLSQFNWSAVNCVSKVYAQGSSGEAYGKLMHRFILKPTSYYEVDHINQCTTDNRRSNLRLCNHSENLANSPSRGGSSRFKGVHWVDGKWRSQIGQGKKRIYLGRFSNEETAAMHYDVAALYLYGDFAYLNFPDRKSEYLEIITNLEGEFD